MSLQLIMYVLLLSFYESKIYRFFKWQIANLSFFFVHTVSC